MVRLAGLLLTLLLLLLPGLTWAADSSITTPDAGKAIDTSTVTTGAGTVHRQGLKVCDPSASTCAAVGASGLSVTGPLTDTQLRSTAVPVSGSGTFTTKEIRAATPTQSSVAGSASNVTCLASNTNRLGATIFNDSAAVLRVKLGATASTTSFTVKLVSEAYYEIPFAYTGIVDCIWESATGNARITELAN